MNRNLASALHLGTVTAVAVFAVAAIASGSARADDITIDTTPFVSTKTRAEVRAELMNDAPAIRAADNEWARQHNQAQQTRSDYTRAQATADYLMSRQYVNALYGEDSGSALLMKSVVPVFVAKTEGASSH